ncbi:MAG: UDP-N-acetylmuramoyl-L-alanyl-D-glutamate--2,6-diaminopimelate ligase [Porcipelethomonas sp.]
MKLYRLLEGLAETKLPDIEISMITDNTKKVQKDCVFVCVKGGSFDGHSAAEEMLEKGAAAVVCERDLGLGDRQIIVSDSRKCYGQLCAAWFDHPERKIDIIGITGTNGKTTTTTVIKNILMKNGIKTGLIGTIRNEIGDEAVHTDNTTPMAFDYMQLLDRMVRSGCRYAVMEVSSFGLVQKRIGPTHFKIGVFTNLTQDHLDYHKTMEEYYQAKKIMFDSCDYAIVNTDDEYGKRLFGEISCEKSSYSITGEADYYADAVKIKSSGTSFWYCSKGKSQIVNMKMTGMFNVSNVTAAIAVCTKIGIPTEKVIESVSDYSGVKGRCEVIPTGRDFMVICDYAHTPDAIENILKNVKEYTEGRLICLFGCGGNRDAKKRPLMAKAAAEYADRLVITSDNPRDEIPEAIIDDILTGLKDTQIPFDVVVDRTEAIYHSLKIAQKGDIIVLAGKGHEDYQVLPGNEHIHFDEREIVSEGLKLLD